MFNFRILLDLHKNSKTKLTASLSKKQINTKGLRVIIGAATVTRLFCRVLSTTKQFVLDTSCLCSTWEYVKSRNSSRRSWDVGSTWPRKSNYFDVQRPGYGSNTDKTARQIIIPHVLPGNSQVTWLIDSERLKSSLLHNTVAIPGARAKLRSGWCAGSLI